MSAPLRDTPLSHSGTPTRPFTVLIAALGGEGGGVLADWLIAAAAREGFAVQSTSIPGVSQRTGATTYYLELYTLDSGGRLPVMALLPSPGGIDLMVASELVEAGRAMQNAFVTADRTTLVASTHRIYATCEKMIPGDGRYDSDKILAAAKQLARQAILFDMAALAREANTVINAVLFGAMAGSGRLPLSRAACEAAIVDLGTGGEASTRGFALGFDQAVSKRPVREIERPPMPAHAAPATLGERVRDGFPQALHELLCQAVSRLSDYQDVAYAEQFLDRVGKVLAVDRECHGDNDGFKLTRETARLLTLWMCYEDVIRVADLKTRASRLLRVRSKARADAGQPVVIVDYLKPGADEIADLLPPAWAEKLRKWQRRRGEPWARALRLKTSSVGGFLVLRLLALAKPWRRRSSRFEVEQATIERWVNAVTRLGFAMLDRELAMDIVQCARLNRGYGETLQRGRKSLAQIFDSLLENEAAAAQGIDRFKLALVRARKAALADTLGAPPSSVTTGAATPVVAKPVIWMKAG